MLIGFRTAHNKPATEEFLIVQFLDSTFRFLHVLHLHERKTFRALVMAITYDFRVLDVAYAIKQLEEIAFSGVEGQVADIQTRRRYVDPFWFARRSRWLRTISWLCRRFLFSAAIAEEFRDTLPECLFLYLRRFLWGSNAVVISPASGPTARAAWASSR